MKKFRNQKGFTLIELLIVIVIIGILAVALLPKILGAPARARDAARKADLNQILTGVEVYYNDNLKYPAALSDVAPLMKNQAVPVDPLTGADYEYTLGSPANSYAVGTCLEIEYTPTGATSPQKLYEVTGGPDGSISTGLSC